MGTVLTLGMLVVICGFIAYSGDVLGRRLGKRRLTLWGLRPRHTAIVSTVVTGMGIAVLTLAALFSLSAGVRLAVLQGEGLLRENYRLAGANRTMATENARERRHSEELQRRIEAQTTQIQEQRRTNERLEQTKATLDRELELRRDEVRSLKRERRELEARLATLDRNRRLILAENRRLRTETSDARLQLRATQVQLASARTGLATMQQRLAWARRARDQQIDAFHRERERRVALAGTNLVARAREELARVVLPPGRPKPEIREIVEELVRRAQREVEQRRPAARATALPKVALVPTWAAPSDVVNAFVERVRSRATAAVLDPGPEVRGHAEGMVLRAIVMENAAPGGPVPVTLTQSINRLAFRKGEEIASLTVDGRQTEGELLRTLLGFLQTRVREEALDKGVLPRADGRVGEIQYDPLLTTIRKIQQIQGPARVGVIAGDDVWSAGPVPIDFYVLPVEARVADDGSR